MTRSPVKVNVFNPCHWAIACNFFMIDPVPVQGNSNLLKTHFFNKVGDDNAGPVLSQLVLGDSGTQSSAKLFHLVFAFFTA
jgi:hypothetical protein